MTLFKNISLVTISLLFAATVLLAQTATIDSPAPDFTLVDSHGKQHSLSDFAGKYVVLEWINFDCPFVKKHYYGDHMQNLQKKYTAKGVVWLAICSSAEGKQGNYSTSEINKWLTEHEANLNAYLIDESGEVGKMYSAKTTPHMYIINPEGILIYAGAIDSIKSTDQDDVAKAENYIEKALDEAISGGEVTTKVTVPYGCSVKY